MDDICKNLLVEKFCGFITWFAVNELTILVVSSRINDEEFIVLNSSKTANFTCGKLLRHNNKQYIIEGRFVIPILTSNCYTQV